MTEQIIPALIAGSALSLLFKNTRPIGVLCVTLLTALHKLLVVPILLGIGLFIYYKHLHR